MTDQQLLPSAWYLGAGLPTAWSSPLAHLQAQEQRPVLEVVQQPVETRVTRRERPRCKDERPKDALHHADQDAVRFALEPPPIVRLRYCSLGHKDFSTAASNQRYDHYKLNPYFFMLALLVHPHDVNGCPDVVKEQGLLGNTVSSPYALRNDIECLPSGLDLASELSNQCDYQLPLIFMLRWRVLSLWGLVLYYGGQVQIAVQSL
jgi:hypothetical protein